MLKSWSIKNFKPIVDSGELQLAPVTILAGRNSSGKSSLLQSIRMIAQTLGSRLVDRPLLPNERMVQLGTFEDILSDFSDSRELRLGFEIEFEEEEEVWYDDEGTAWPNFGPFVSSAQALVTFRSGNPHNVAASAVEASKVFIEEVSIKAIPTHPLYDSRSKRLTLTDVTFMLRKISEQEFDEICQGMSTEKKRRFPHNAEQIYYIGRFADDTEDNTNIYIPEVSHFLPSDLVKKIDEQDIAFQQAKILVRSLLDKAKNNDEEYLYEQVSLTKATKAAIKKFCGERGINANELGKDFQSTIYYLRDLDVNPLKQEDREALVNLFTSDVVDSLFFVSSSPDDKEAHILDAIGRLTSFFTNQIRYLGPIREKPEIIRQNFAPTSDLDDVGFSGEYAAVVYHSNKNSSIEWYNPSTQHIEKNTLSIALDAWVQYLKIAEHISTEEAGAIGITWQIVIKEGQKARLLPEVGTGISQILPVLVMGLLSPPGSLLIIEQPELHLHPFALARLGDFFMGLAKCKKQCIIETHSENLVSQLRLHVVQAGGLEKSDCLIYFVDQDEQGAAQFEKIRISERGNILNWPEGFFDETLLQQDKITEESLKQRAKLSNL